jgi:exodeoxyribonuclease V alpha subunit
LNQVDEFILPLNKMQLQNLKLVVQRITFTSAEGAYVFMGQGEDGECIKVVSFNHKIFREPRPGDLIHVTGCFDNHPNYGEQFYASFGTYPIPKGKLLINYLSNDIAFKGIGKKYARALYETFKDNLVIFLNESRVDKICEVVPRPVAVLLIENWHEQKEITALVNYLDAHGFDIRLANKVI